MWEWIKALFQRPEPENDTTFPDDPEVPDDVACPDTQPSQPGALGP